MRCLVSGICNNGFRLGKGFCYLVVYLIKSNTVMYIAGSYHRFQHKAMAITGRMRLVRKLPLVVSLDEQAAVRVSYAFCDHACLVFLPAGQLLSGGIVLSLLWRLIIERLLSVGFPIRVDLLHQFLCIVPGCRRYRSLDLFLCVGIGFDVGAVNEDRLGRQISCLRYFL